jgi:ribosome maturation factor RimP
MNLEQEIRQLAEGSLKDASQFIVDVVLSSRKGPKKLLVVVDGDQGISIDDCAEISRVLSEKLDAIPGLDDKYMLEVSTPGLDQPLKMERQYRKNVGRTLKVKTNTKTVTGLLTTVTAEGISLEEAKGTGKKKELVKHSLGWMEIEKALVQISFK